MAEGHHSIEGERSWHMDNYDLPKHDVDKTMRNFAGFEKKEYYDMEDIRNGDWFGSTDTDYNSHVHEDESKTKDHSRDPGSEMGYTKINDTHGTAGDQWVFKTSSPRQAEHLNKKPKKGKAGIPNPQGGSRTKR